MGPRKLSNCKYDGQILGTNPLTDELYSRTCKTTFWTIFLSNLRVLLYIFYKDNAFEANGTKHVCLLKRPLNKLLNNL